MKLNGLIKFKLLDVGRWIVSGLLLTGCRSISYDDPNPSKPYLFPSQRHSAATEVAAARMTPPPAPVTDARTTPLISGTPRSNTPSPPIASNPSQDATQIVLQKGDFVIVTFSDTPTLLPEHQERVRDDGNMTLIYNITVKAADKTIGQLQEDIRAALVPKYFKYLTVTARVIDRYYFVGGEVKQPNRQVYYGKISVLRAIDTAYGFTDFANRKNIELRRANGEKFRVNWYKAIKDPKLDPEVFPNDQILVHKKSAFGF